MTKLRFDSLVFNLLAIGFLLGPCTVHASTITLHAASRGSTDQAGDGTGFSGFDIGNFLTGRHSGIENRSFFVFDLADVLNPITEATLLLELSPTLFFKSDDASETVSFVEFSGPLSDLFRQDYPSQLTPFTSFDFIGGAVYGMGVLTAASPGTLQVNFNEIGVLALNAALQGDGMFAFGGILTSLDTGRSEQFLFGSSACDAVSLQLQTSGPESYQSPTAPGWASNSPGCGPPYVPPPPVPERSYALGLLMLGVAPLFFSTRLR